MGDVSRRDVFRSTLTRITVFIAGTEFSKASQALLETKLTAAESAYEKLLGEHMLLVEGSTTPEALETQNSYLAAVEEVYHDSIAKLRERINELSVQSVSSGAAGRDTTNVIQVRQEQRIKLTTFKGDFTKWREFRDQFITEVHNCASMANVTKLRELKSALEGAPARLISRWQLTDANYDEAWAKLNDVYDNKQNLVDAHLNALHAIPKLGKESSRARGLRDLVNEANVHLSSLRTLGLSTATWDPIIVNMLRSRLDYETNHAWQMSRNDVREIATLKEFFEFLERRASALDSAFFDNEQQCAAANQRPVQRSGAGASTQRAASTVRCPLCKEQHPLYRCGDFLALSVAGRNEKVRNWRLCANCLQSGHFAQSCPGGACRRCNKKHNSVLCSEHTSAGSSLAVVASASKSQPEDNKAVTTSSN